MYSTKETRSLNSYDPPPPPPRQSFQKRYGGHGIRSEEYERLVSHHPVRECFTNGCKFPLSGKSFVA